MSARGPVTERAEFSGEALPAGWRIESGRFASPGYPGAVRRVALEYAARPEEGAGVVAVYAVDHSEGGEWKVADLDVRTNGAALDFPESSNYRSFLVECDGAALRSFAATWVDGRLDAPLNVRVAGFGHSHVDVAWDPVEDAAGYQVTVWTNMTTGSCGGTVEWAETWAGLKTSASGSASLENNKDVAGSRADHPDEWTDMEDAYLSRTPAHVKLGTSTGKAGWLVVPAHGRGEGLHLRFSAARFDGKDDGQNLAVDFVSTDGTQTNREVFALSVYEKVFHRSLAGLEAGWKVVLAGVPREGAAREKDCRVDLGEVAYVRGYAPGDVQRVVLGTARVDGGTTAATVGGLPGVKVEVGVTAIGSGEAEDSALSGAVAADLSAAPRPAVPAGEMLPEGGYVETFASLGALPASSAWRNFVTLPYWQAVNGGADVERISAASGMAGKSGGLYVYHGTNRSETAGLSLAAVANTSNGISFGFAVTNDTCRIFDGLSLRFTARQWTFNGDRKAAQSLRLAYCATNEVVSLGAVGDWVEVDSVRFDALAPGAGNALAAGAARADFATGSVKETMVAALEGVRLMPGKVLVFRWTPDAVAGGEVLGVDDVSFAYTARPIGTVLLFAGM
jgi:hypothetical protein